MWGMVKRAFQLSLLMLVELPIRLLMLLFINVLGLILPELVVWMARTVMIRHARSSSILITPIFIIVSQVRGDG